MQGFERADRQLLDAALSPAGQQVSVPGHHRAEVFDDEDYRDMFAPPRVSRQGQANPGVMRPQDGFQDPQNTRLRASRRRH